MATEPTLLEIFKNEIKNEQKMEEHIFWHPCNLELCISLQTPPYLVTSQILSISLKPSLGHD